MINSDFREKTWDGPAHGVWLHMCKYVEDAYWPNLVSLFRVSYRALGHYFGYFFTLVVVVVLVGTLLAFTPEGIVVGFQIFAWAPK